MKIMDYIAVAADPENECEHCGHHRGMHFRGGCTSYTIERPNKKDQSVIYCKCQCFKSLAEAVEKAFRGG